ncbi:MAG: hypothetical protein H6831_12555 [Planctomycetes bacterium]|nr:hypothetical protein [Planctomycetota bacterium]MCB9905230.1 hypothetical protein [Planctomycetota bacterium]
MKLRTLTCALLASLAGAMTLTDASVAASPAPANAPIQNSHDEFRSKFAQAMELNANEEMASLVRKNTAEAVAWIMETAEAISTSSNEALERRMAALRKAWKTAKDSKFCDHMYEYFSLLEPALKTERNKLKVRYEKALTKYRENLEAKNGQGLELQSIEFAGLAEAFETLGDMYFASQSWLLAGGCVNESSRGDEADNDRAADFYGKCIEDRLKIDLKDQSYVEAKALHDSLVGRGFGNKNSGSDDEPGGAAPVEAAPAITVPLKFELLEEWDAFERPLYVSDEIYQLWTGLYLKTKGTSERLTSLDKRSPGFLRVGANEVQIDIDGDGNGDQKLPITGNQEPVAFKIDNGQRDWGMIATIGLQQEQYQGIEVNLAPADNQLTIYIHPAASVVGALEGEQIRVLDDNLDGIYGSAPRSWSYVGMSKEHFCPDMDAIVVGKGKRARPWSELQEIGGKWYRMQVDENGTSLTATPVDVKTGTLKYKYAGGKPEWIVVQGTDELANCYFEVTSKGIEVPAGKYRLFYGDLRKGKKQQVTKALIIPGRTTKTVSLQEGKVETLELGAPYGFDFQTSLDGETLTLTGQSVVVVGSAGERYERVWNCVPRPEVSWRKTGTKKGSKGEETDVVMSSDQLDKLGWESGWFPRDLVMTLKGSHDAVEVQLFEKKNKLFGKITSDWKE